MLLTNDFPRQLAQNDAERAFQQTDPEHPGHALAVFEANRLRNHRISEQAKALASKSMPARHDPAPSAYFDPAEAIKRAAYTGKRNRLIKLACAELRAAGFADELWLADYRAALDEADRWRSQAALRAGGAF